jgi:hypothetical protein
MKDIFRGERIEVGLNSPEAITIALEPLDYRVYVVENDPRISTEVHEVVTLRVIRGPSSS